MDASGGEERFIFDGMRRAVLHLKNADPVLAEVIEKIGPCRMAYREPGFDSLARAIVFQQLNGRAAATIFARLTAACGDSVLSAERLLGVSPRKLRSIGLSAQKTAYLRDLARKTRDGWVDFAALGSLADEEVIERLTAVKGIGDWTAQMFLIFALRRPDVLPTGDYGIRSAMRRLYKLETLPKAAEMEAIAAAWRPWRSVGSWYLWRTLDGPAGI
jgi:DNA-3-methyladenine glycosylase II